MSRLDRMTREEAIYELLNAFKYNVNDSFMDACSMAIEALKAEPTDGDLISRADAIEVVADEFALKLDMSNYDTREIATHALSSLPSADADGEDLIIKGAKGIQDGLYNIKDGKLFKYKAKGGTVRTYPIVPSAEAVQGWIPCSERLPKEKERVLTYDNIGHIDFGQYDRGQWYWEAEACADYWMKNDGVLAWMPLPTPYKGGEDE